MARWQDEAVASLPARVRLPKGAIFRVPHPRVLFTRNSARTVATLFIDTVAYCSLGMVGYSFASLNTRTSHSDKSHNTRGVRIDL